MANATNFRARFFCRIGLSDRRRIGAARRVSARGGEINPEIARLAFMAAAHEAGILIGEAPVRG